MNLNLKRPVAFFDLETTGLNPVHDRIIEISILKIDVNGFEEQKSWRINPGIPIPPETTELHGITDADVADCPNFKQLAPALSAYLDNCDLAGYNILKFDLPFIVEEFMRADVEFEVRNRNVIDVMNIFMKMEPRTLRGAYRFFFNKDFENAHSASADTVATYEVLCAMLDKYQNRDFVDNKGTVIKQPVSNDVHALAVFSAHHQNADLMGQIVYDEFGREVFKFGKYKDMPVEDVFRKEPQYYDWIMRSDFPQYTKKIITGIKLRMSGKNIKY